MLEVLKGKDASIFMRKKLLNNNDNKICDKKKSVIKTNVAIFNGDDLNVQCNN